jgi:hypothetical protein
VAVDFGAFAVERRDDESIYRERGVQDNGRKSTVERDTYERRLEGGRRPEVASEQLSSPKKTNKSDLVRVARHRSDGKK